MNTWCAWGKTRSATFCRAADGTASRSPGSRCRPRPPLWRMHYPKKHDYGARSWKCQRRVIIKADIALRSRPQAQVTTRADTNLTTTPKFIYQGACARGDISNRIKELKHGPGDRSHQLLKLQSQPVSAPDAAAAYVLMQELRLHARRTGCARAQVNTLRLRSTKVRHLDRVSVRRIVLHLPHERRPMRMTGGASLALSVPCPHSQSPRAKCSTAISASPEQRTRLPIIHCAFQHHDHSAFTPMAPKSTICQARCACY